MTDSGSAPLRGKEMGQMPRTHTGLQGFTPGVDDVPFKMLFNHGYFRFLLRWSKFVRGSAKRGQRVQPPLFLVLYIVVTPSY